MNGENILNNRIQRKNESEINVTNNEINAVVQNKNKNNDDISTDKNKEQNNILNNNQEELSENPTENVPRVTFFSPQEEEH